jgi:hypothetical protein
MATNTLKKPDRVFKHRTLEQTLAAKRAKREQEDRETLIRITKIMSGLPK